MMYSGLLIQVSYHMGNQGFINADHPVMNINYSGWSGIHKTSIILVSVFIAIHFTRHWKWYTTIVRKKLFSRNWQVLILTLLFILVALTGYIPWIVASNGGSEVLRKSFIEVHDKLALLLTVYLILHISKRLKWYFTIFKKIIHRQEQTKIL